MTFSDFLNAVRSAWGWFNNAGILLAVLAGVGINAVCAEVPTWLAVVLCVVAYVAGFLAACYGASAEASGRQAHEQPEGQASRIASLEAELAGRPTQEDVDELRRQVSARDAELATLRGARTPTRLDIARSTLGDDGMRSFRALCAASTYVDGAPARPLVFDMDDGRLSRVGLDVASLRLMEEAGLVRIAEADERDLVGAQSRTEPADVGDGVTACAGSVAFALAGGEEVSVRPVRLTYGTCHYVAEGVYGADLGVASFTSLGRELASECAALEPPLRMREYLEDAYSASLRDSRHHFRSVSDEEGVSA